MLIYDRRKLQPIPTLIWENMGPRQTQESRRMTDRNNGIIATVAREVPLYDKRVKKSS